MSADGVGLRTVIAAYLAMIAADVVAAVLLTAVIAVHDDPHAVLFERVQGRTDLHNDSAETQDAVYRHYLEILGDLHRLDPDQLDLGDVHRPTDAHDCAMAEVDALGAGIDGFGPQPLSRFGMSWLRRHAPTHVERIALLHGDAGIANFLYVNSKITAAIDWEWAHLGDPMEDLGNLCIHASFSPSGEWPALLPHYEQVSGIPVETDKVFYYRVQNMARSVLALVPIRERLNSRDPVALNQCFAIVCDRMLCDAIADAMQVELEDVDVPDVGSDTTLYDVVVENLERDIGPHVDGDFPRDRLAMSVLLVQTLARRHALQPWHEATQLDELEALLGARPPDVIRGLGALDELIAADDGRRDVEILHALSRMARRAEAISAPVVSLFPDARLRPIV
jgi:hypothetical protein